MTSDKCDCSHGVKDMGGRCVVCKRLKPAQPSGIMCQNDECVHDNCEECGHGNIKTVPVVTEADHQAEIERLKTFKEDAEKWRALISADRIRVLGSAGFPEQGSDNKTNYRHFGIDVWNGTVGSKEEKESAIELLNWFIESIKLPERR